MTSVSTVRNPCDEGAPGVEPAFRKHPIVLGIKGSPRRGGNTDLLLEAALAAARDAGAVTRVLVASESGLQPCRGCNACSVTGTCVIDDGGSAVHAAIDDADGIIVATPVYFASVPGVLKVMIDRLQPYWARRYALGQPLECRRPGGIIMVRAGGDPYGFAATAAVVRSAFAVLGVDVLAVAEFEGYERPREIEQEGPLTRAAQMGTLIAREASQCTVAPAVPPVDNTADSDSDR